MRILVVSTYLPERCGIARYAWQLVEHLRSQGHVVNVLAPPGSLSDFCEDLRGAGVLRILKYAPFYDKVIVNFHESFFYRGGVLGRLITHISLSLLFLAARNIEVICHEYLRAAGGILGWADRLLLKAMWRLAPKVVFHTRRELEEFRRRYGDVNSEVRRHGEAFRKMAEVSKAEARRRLGLSEEDFILLCIGFIQPHKGFDRALRAFRSVGSSRVKLYVVGSIRLLGGWTLRYLRELRELADSCERAYLVYRYLSDEEFDLWIIASDVVVLPYREIWSSGVLERAKLYGRPVIASDVGGLREQLSDVDYCFKSDEELEEALRVLSELVDEASAASSRRAESSDAVFSSVKE